MCRTALSEFFSGTFPGPVRPNGTNRDLVSESNASSVFGPGESGRSGSSRLRSTFP